MLFRSLVCLPLPLPCEPRRIGVVWSRATIRHRLVTAFLREAQAVMHAHAAPQATKAWS